jgi:penicillin-binding protein 1A
VRRLPTARLVRVFGLVALFLGAALAGTASGVLFASAGDLPQISALDDYSPGTITRVLGRDGSLVGEFANERRVLVSYDDIPEVLRQAIIASEDGDFFSHGGLDLQRIAATAVRRYVLRTQRFGGASTITQQLARKLFLTDEQTPERKIKEALLAIQIEKRYTKREIFTMYCNKMYWGHHAYGVEAASQLYFAKSVKDLNLDEAALIAGLLQLNVRQSPYVNMRAAVTRRNSVLTRMAAEGFISANDAEAAKARPIEVRGQPVQPPSLAPYFQAMIRSQLEDRYGAKAVDDGGLVVRTGLDPGLQRAANAALDARLRAYDKTRGYRKPARNVLAEGQTPDGFRLNQWQRDPEPDRFQTALVMGIDGGRIELRAGKWRGVIEPKGYSWTRRRATQIVKAGDLVEVQIASVDPKASTFTANLDQVPEVQGAVVAIDNHSGNILAMVGGQNFERSQFNRAVQAQRQVGSLFKPFVYLTAIDKGYTPLSVLIDEPTAFEAGPGQPLYEPKNYDHVFLHEVTLRHALEDSRNVPTVRLMVDLGIENVIRTARQLGVTSPLPPFLSIAIGSAEGSLLEMTSAYSAFANQGVRMTPRLVLNVTDREGTVLEEHRPEPQVSITADTAYMITMLLKGVVERGTARSAAALNWPLAGKTGTTDDYTDAWFIGFDPDITVGVWVGFDQKKTLGPKMEGSALALPVWRDIMRSWIERRRAELADPPDFERPGNVVAVQLENGVEYFIAGTEPRRPPQNDLGGR